jgi:hypothetical protein
VIDTSFTDKGFDLILDWSDSSSVNGKLEMVMLCSKLDGSRGNGSDIEKLVSMRTTDVNVGLSFGSSWTHSKAIWRHLVISFLE